MSEFDNPAVHRYIKEKLAPPKRIGRTIALIALVLVGLGCIAYVLHMGNGVAR